MTEDTICDGCRYFTGWGRCGKYRLPETDQPRSILVLRSALGLCGPDARGFEAVRAGNVIQFPAAHRVSS